MNETGKTRVDESWLDLLDDYDVQWVILDPHDDSDVAETIRSQPGWDIDTDDDNLIIFTRAGKNCDSHP